MVSATVFAAVAVAFLSTMVGKVRKGGKFDSKIRFAICTSLLGWRRLRAAGQFPHQPLVQDRLPPAEP